jgi:hypothetical protein
VRRYLREARDGQRDAGSVGLDERPSADSQARPQRSHQHPRKRAPPRQARRRVDVEGDQHEQRDFRAVRLTSVLPSAVNPLAPANTKNDNGFKGSGAVTRRHLDDLMTARVAEVLRRATSGRRRQGNRHQRRPANRRAHGRRPGRGHQPGNVVPTSIGLRIE